MHCHRFHFKIYLGTDSVIVRIYIGMCQIREQTIAVQAMKTKAVFFYYKKASYAWVECHEWRWI